MKVIFELDPGKDKNQLYVMQNAMDLYLCLFSFSSWLREQIKYSDQAGIHYSNGNLATLFKVEEEFYGILEKYNINLDKVT